METIQQVLKRENIKYPEPEAIDYENTPLIDKTLSEENPGIKPTAEDFYRGKAHAYLLASQRKISEEKEEKRLHRIKEYTSMWSIDEMAERALTTGKAIGINENFDFVIDAHNNHVFKLLCLYFTNNPQFETYGIGEMKYSLRKGIWLQSNVNGCGKSVLLRCFQINKRNCFGYKHTGELANMFQKGGFGAIDIFMNTLPQPSSPANFYQEEAGMMYDELFTGQDKVNHMGSPIFISNYIVNSLYDFSTGKNKNNKWKFHCTSNASGEDIEKIAGRNFRSRMADMFNLIKIEGPDRRRA